MSTTAAEHAQAGTGPRSLAALRGNCMGAAVMLIVQFALGIGLNLYVTLPAHKSLPATISSSLLLIAHFLLALGLLGASVGALIRSLRAHAMVPFTVLGLLAILAAWGGGMAFANSQGAGASLTMALATAVAMFSYLAVVFRLR